MEEERKRKITIVSCQYYIAGYDGDFFTLVTKGITDWVEVTNEEYMEISHGVGILNSRLKNQYHYTLIQQQENTKDLIFKSIDAVKKAVKEQREYQLQLEKQKTEKQKLRELKQKTKNQKQRQEMYEQLKKEFEPNENQS